MNRRIEHKFAQLERAARKVHLWMEITMAGIDELNAKIAELNQLVKDDEAQDDATEAALNQTIVDLKAQIGSQTPLDTQPFIDALEAIKANLHTPPSLG